MKAAGKISEVRDLLVILKKNEERIDQHHVEVQDLRAEQENIAKQLASLEDDLRNEIQSIVAEVLNREPWSPPKPRLRDASLQ